MGTRSTVHFQEIYVDEGQIKTVDYASYYQQYDGYPSGVGRQVLNLLEKYDLVNGITLGEDRKIANGITELALFYVLENKDLDSNGNLYATNKDDRQDYNYFIQQGTKKSERFGYDSFIKQIIVDSFGDVIFKGSIEEFAQFIEENEV